MLRASTFGCPDLDIGGARRTFACHVEHVAADHSTADNPADDDNNIDDGRGNRRIFSARGLSSQH